LKFLCGLLNSKLIFNYIKIKYSSSSYCGGITFTKDMINNFPIPLNYLKFKQAIVTLVNQILLAKKLNINSETVTLENQIDELVYKLYNLTYDEIKVIEPNFWLSNEEYNNLPAIEAEEPQYNNIKNNPEETELSEPKTPKKRGSRGISVDGLEF